MNNKILTLLIIIFSGFIHLYAQDMNFYWAKQYGHDNFPSDIQSVTSDNQDNIICFTHFNSSFTVEDQTFNSEGGEDLLVYSISEEGTVEWAFSFGGTDNQYASEVSCDDDGNIYLMGQFSNQISLNGEIIESNGSFDNFLIQLNASGEIQWIKTYGGPKSEAFISMNISDDKINIVGRFYQYTIIENDTLIGVDGTDFYIAQFDLSGNLLQYRIFGGSGVDYVSDVATDNLGNTYICGDFYQTLQIGEETLDSGDLLGVYLVKLNSNLDVDWVFQPVGEDIKPAPKLSCDAYGHIAMAGNFSGQIEIGNISLQTADFDEDIYVSYFTPEGNVMWAKRFYSSSMENVSAFEMDRFGHLYICGHYLDHIHFNDILIEYNLCCGESEIFFVKLDEEGEVLNYNQITGERTSIADMVVPEVNQVILAGKFSEVLQLGDLELNSPSSYNVFVGYYKDDTWLFTNQISKEYNFIKSSYSNSYFELYQLPAEAKLQVFNINGQLIEDLTLHSSELHLGQSWNSGMYFIKLIQPNQEVLGLKVLKI